MRRRRVIKWIALLLLGVSLVTGCAEPKATGNENGPHSSD